MKENKSKCCGATTRKEEICSTCLCPCEVTKENKITEMFEGENSSLRKTYDEATKTEQDCQVCGREGGHIMPIDKSVKQYQEDIKAGVDVGGKKCKECQFEEGEHSQACSKVKTEQIMESEVKLAEEGTPLAIFQKERTDAITDMFNNEYGGGLYPTTQFFCRLDQCVSKLLSEQRQSIIEKVEGLKNGLLFDNDGKDITWIRDNFIDTILTILRK